MIMPYDYLFEPTFTQTVSEINHSFAVGILKQLVPSLERPSKKLDEDYWANVKSCVNFFFEI